MATATAAAKATISNPKDPPTEYAKSGGAQGILPDIVSNPLAAALEPFKDIGRFFGLLVNPHFWLRVLMVVGGIALIVVALGIVVFDKTPTPAKRLIRKGLK